MDFWASLEHKIYYKFEGKAPSHIRRELKECADLVSFLDKKMLSINEEVQMLSEPSYTEYEEPEQTTENPAQPGTPVILDAEYIEEQTEETRSSDAPVFSGPRKIFQKKC